MDCATRLACGWLRLASRFALRAAGRCLFALSLDLIRKSWVDQSIDTLVLCGTPLAFELTAELGRPRRR